MLIFPHPIFPFFFLCYLRNCLFFNLTSMEHLVPFLLINAGGNLWFLHDCGLQSTSMEAPFSSQPASIGKSLWLGLNAPFRCYTDWPLIHLKDRYCSLPIWSHPITYLEGLDSSWIFSYEVFLGGSPWRSWAGQCAKIRGLLGAASCLGSRRQP
jgi:hypothetical protein